MEKITKNDLVRIMNNPEVVVTDEFGTHAFIKNNHILYFEGDDTEYDLNDGFVLADGGRMSVVLDAGMGARCEIELIVKAEVENVMDYA